MRIVAFSDGHVGEYLEGYSDPISGLNTRLIDTLNVWTWVHGLAVDKKADCVVFGGDRFKPKRPPAWMRDLADALVIPFRESGIPLAMLKGNHDMWDKGRRWTTYGGINVWRKDKDPLWVFDTPGVLDFNGLCLAFLPYGSHDIPFEDLNPEGRNVLVFHDDVRGMSDYGHHIADGGLDPKIMDRGEFMFVMGGHVHLRQTLDFHHTIGLHIGTPLERIEDGDQGPKGALVIDIDDPADGIGLEFFESPMPKVVRQSFSWKGDLEECVASVQNIKGNIVQLVVLHTGSVPSGLRREIVKKLRERGVASADVRLQAEFQHGVSAADVIIGSMLPLEEEVAVWTAKQTDDKKLVGYLEQVVKRAG